MFKTLQKAVVAVAMAASALTVSTAAEARDGYYRHRGGGDDAAIAIGAGLVGLAIGAAVASDGNRHHRRYYDSDYYYYDARPRYRSYYYYDSYPRYYRYNRPYRNHYYRHDRRWRGDGWGYRRNSYRYYGRGW